MNYDAQQYAFSHGLATTPQLNLHQHQLHQQQQQIFQQQYSQAVPTSNVYQFHFAGGGNSINPIFQQKDAHPVGMSGNMQSRMAQHSMVPQPFIKQGVPMGIDGSSVHVVGRLNGMIYSEQKNNIKIIRNPDGRVIQQPEGAVRMQPALVGVDMMGTSNFLEQSLDAQQQHQGMRVTGQGNIFTYNKQHFSGWLQPQPISAPVATQHTTVCQSTLPSFSHVWSQYPHHKQIDIHHQQQHINQYQQSQHLQHQIQQQQQMQAQQHFAASSFQALPGIQVIKMQQQPKPQQASVPVSVQTVPHLPQKLNCFSPSQLSLMSPDCTDKEIPSTNRGMQCVERGITVSSQALHSLSCTQPLSSCDEHQPSTSVTYTISGPPKVTVTLDSLTHGETFSPNRFPERSDASFSADSTSSNFTTGKAVELANNRVTPSVLSDNCLSQPQQEWQMSQHHRNICLPKSHLHTSSIGSSFERSSSEGSNFSSPPYTFTPPSSIDSMFSPVHMQFPKPVTENSSSSGRTSGLSSSSSMMSSSPPVPLYMSSWPGNQSTGTTVPIVASSVASSTSTTSTTAVVFSCNTVAMTTTSVTSTTPSPKESTNMASVHSGMNYNSISCIPGTHLSCNPVRRPSALVADSETSRKVKVPYSWQRKYENGVIVYLSPSGAVLESFEHICQYLLSDSTCKCGLECPIQVEKFFSFDPEVESQPWTAAYSAEHLGNLCNHRREIVALAAFHNSKLEATANSADHCLEMGKKRERKKSVSVGEGLIVAPLKRLKTSITNAVNKHAMSLGNSTLRASAVVGEKPEALNVDLPFHRVSQSPVDSKGICTNHSNLSAGRLDCKRLQCSVGNNEKLPGSLQVQNVSDHDDKQTVPRHQQFHDNQQSYRMNSMRHTFMQLEDNLLFHEGHGREPATSLSNHFSMDIGFQGNQHQMQYPQSQHSQHHSQQPANPNMFFPQGHVYPNMPHVTHQQPQGFHPGMWQGGNPNSPAGLPHSRHHPRPYPPNLNFQHSNFNHPQSNNFPQFSTLNQQAFGNQSLVDPKKIKSKRPKSKKDKQKQINSIVDRSSPCLKALSKTAKPNVVPSMSASFFGNPIVFVEQQTAIINNSIASCHLTCPTPSPPQPKLLTSQPLQDDIARENMAIKPCRDTEPFKNVSLEDLDKNGSSDKDEEEDQKTGTDLDSNKSFSDTTENNDSAYLSQTGSDQERSDTIDGLDSCMDTTSKSSDIYYFNSSEEQESRRSMDFSHIDKKSLEEKTCIIDSQSSNNSPTNEAKSQQEVRSVQGRAPCTVNKVQDNKKAAKPRQKLTQAQKNVLIQDVELLKKVLPNNVNGKLPKLLASNNWSVPVLQKVLAQYSGEDLGQLNTAAQHVWSHISGTEADFPASNLLSAAARAQLNLKQEKTATLLPHGLNTAGLQNLNTEILTASTVSNPSVSDSKAVIVPSSHCHVNVSSVVTQQPQSSFQQVGKGTNLAGNMMQVQQLTPGSFAMNMLLPANGQGHAYATDSVHTGTLHTDPDVKSGQRTINPLIAQGMLATVSQTGDIGSQIKLPLASVIPSCLAPNVAQCNPDGNTLLLNNFGPRMIMNAPMPPVSVSVVTNVTKSLTQVVPAISINQTVFGTHQVTQQLLSTQQNGPQIINTGAPAPGTHIINTSPQGAQLVTTAPQGRQFVNPPPQSTQLVGSTPQTSQFVNALSVQGLNNQLLITNPIQQVSPSNSISQLSPAMAAHILAQGHQQLQQISPSFLQNQIHKQNSVINNQNIFASVSLPAVTVTSGCSDVIASSISQAGIISNNIQKNPHTSDSLGNVDIGNSITHIKDTTASLSNTSVYAATSQPVFVIPQPSSNPLMQMLGSAQPLNTTSGLSTDLNIQQGNLSQIFGQSTTIDQVQLQNLLAAGFNPLQQMMNAVNLNGVQQQQQQLQLLHLQQLMLQQLQNQGHNIQGISLPLNQNTLNSSAGQTTAIGAPAIVNAIMPQQGLQLSSVMDMNNIHPCLSPVAQGFQNQLPSAAAQLQHISSALTVQQVTSVNSCGTVGVVQNGNLQNLVQATPKHLQSGLSLQPQSVFSDLVSQSIQPPTVNPSTTQSYEPLKNTTTQAQKLTAGSLKSPVTTVSVAKPCQPSKPKSKSKSKKSESKKIVDPESERNEEDIAATVQQILAQAVQQQKELSLAAKNQPPPTPKSKSKKSQSRSKANQASKEHDLGKLASISDDVTIPRSEDLRLKDKPALEILPNCPGLIEPSHFTLVAAKSSHGDVRQSLAISQSNHITFPSPAATSTQSSHPFSSLVISSPAVTSFVEQTLNETNFVNFTTKKSSISLKDHLSSIVSKDKDSNNKKPSSSPVQKHGRVKNNSDTKVSHTIQPTAVISGDTSFHPKTQRTSIK